MNINQQQTKKKQQQQQTNYEQMIFEIGWTNLPTILKNKTKFILVNNRKK